MKTTALILALLLCFTGTVFAMSAGFMGGGQTVAAAGAPATPDLVWQDYESGSETFDSCGDSNNMIAWAVTRGNGTGDCTFAAPALEGSESLYITDSEYETTFAGTDSKVYITTAIRFETGVDHYPFNIRDSGGTCIIALEADWDDVSAYKVKLYYAASCGTNGTASAALFALDTLYYFKIEFDNGAAGGGDDGTLQFFYSADPFSSWTNIAVMDETAAEDDQMARIETAGKNVEVIFDAVGVGTSDYTY